MTLLDLPEIDEGLRDYQKLGKKKIYQAWESCSAVMFQMPTGTGKTRLFSSTEFLHSDEIGSRGLPTRYAD